MEWGSSRIRFVLAFFYKRSLCAMGITHVTIARLPMYYAGPHGILITESHIALQEFIVKEQQSGVLICLCSKNILRDIEEAFELRKDEMPLKYSKHILLAKVNWEEKSANIKEIAQELSLGILSIKLLRNYQSLRYYQFRPGFDHFHR